MHIEIKNTSSHYKLLLAQLRQGFGICHDNVLCSVELGAVASISNCNMAVAGLSKCDASSECFWQRRGCAVAVCCFGPTR